MIVMRKLRVVLFFIILSVSCIREQEPALLCCEKIGFESYMSRLKSGFDEDMSSLWEADDMVGIFAGVDGRAFGDNCPHYVKINTQDYSHSLFVPIGDGLTWQGSGTYEFYAYAPYMMEGCTAEKIPFELPAVQRGSREGLSDYDVVVSRRTVKVNKYSPSGQADVDFSFSHIFCVVRFEMTSGESMKGRKIVKAFLSSDSMPLSADKGSVDVTSRQFDVSVDGRGSAIVSLELDKPQVLGESPVSLYFMTLPSGRGDVSVSVIMEDGQTLVFEYEDILLESNACLHLSADASSSGYSHAGAGLPLCLSFACKEAKPIYAAVSGDCVSFAGGVTLKRNDGEPISLIGNADNPSVFSKGWTEKSCYMLSVPLKDRFEGRLRMDFKFTGRGIADWSVDWSSDGILWRNCEYLTFDHSNQMEHCTVYIEVPSETFIPAGSCLYIRLRPAGLRPAKYGGLAYADETSDPRLSHSIVLTPCASTFTEKPSGTELFEPFDDCVEGVDAVLFGPQMLSSCVANDGPAYSEALKVWERPGYLKVGEKGSMAQYTTAPIVKGGDMKVELDLAAYFSAVDVYDLGRIVVGISFPSGQEQTFAVSSYDLNDGRWHRCDFEFQAVPAGSAVFVRSSSMRFYVDNITVRRI